MTGSSALARSTEREAGERVVDLGPIEAVPRGMGRAFVVDGGVVAVFRQRDDRLFALDNRCPHRGGPLADGIVGGGIVICPLHGLKFELESGRCAGDGAAVRTHAVAAVGGRIVLRLESRP